MLFLLHGIMMAKKSSYFCQYCDKYDLFNMI